MKTLTSEEFLNQLSVDPTFSHLTIRGNVEIPALKTLHLENVVFEGNLAFLGPIEHICIRNCHLTGGVTGTLCCQSHSFICPTILSGSSIPARLAASVVLEFLKQAP